MIISDDAVNSLINGNPATYQRLVSAYQQLIRQAKAANVGVICSTLTPFKGLDEWTPAIESTRQNVNVFLRDSSGGCDEVLDLAGVLGGPGSSNTAYAPAYNSGNNLHPNDAGMHAIANAIDLGWFSALPPISTPAACGRIAQGEGIGAGGYRFRRAVGRWR